MEGGGIRVVFLPKELYPFERVRLTDLYQKEFTSLGNSITWILQGKERVKVRKEHRTEGNKFIVTGSLGDSSRISLIGNLILFPRKYIELNRITRQRGADIIIVCDGIIDGIVGSVLARRRNIPFVYYLSHLFFDVDINNFKERKTPSTLLRYHYAIITRYLYRWIIGRADLFHPISDSMERYYRKLFPKKRMIPLPLCPGHVFLDNAGAGGKKRNTVKKIIYIGKINKARKTDMYIDVLREVHYRTDIKPHLHLYGPFSESYGKVLLKKAEDAGLANWFHLNPPKPISDIPKLIADADIGISLYPPILVFKMCSPTKAVEYLSQGTPVVGNEEVVDLDHVIRSSGGGFSVPYDVGMIADRIIYLLEREDLAIELGERGRKWVREHRTYRSYALRIQKAYMEIIRNWAGIKEVKD